LTFHFLFLEFGTWNKTKKYDMKIFFIWLGLICCSVTNGLIFDKFMMPEVLLLMCVPTFICVWILYIHRKVTKNWQPYISPRAGDRFPIFALTFFSVLVYSILASYTQSVFIGIITLGISSFIAFCKEIKYANQYKR